ncbi:MAG: hypothetical protein V7L17_21445 [Nostoc sp.]
MLVTDFFHPVHGLAVKPFLNGDVRHGCGCCSTMPMLLTRRDPDRIPRPNLLTSKFLSKSKLSFLLDKNPDACKKSKSFFIDLASL